MQSSVGVSATLSSGVGDVAAATSSVRSLFSISTAVLGEVDDVVSSAASTLSCLGISAASSGDAACSASVTRIPTAASVGADGAASTGAPLPSNDVISAAASTVLSVVVSPGASAGVCLGQVTTSSPSMTEAGASLS